MFRNLNYKKEDVLKQIQELERNLGKKTFERKYRSFFLQACGFLEIPDHAIRDIYKIGDPYLKDSIIWKYMSNFGLNMVFRDYKCFEIENNDRKKRRDIESLWVEKLESFGTINSLPSMEIYTSRSAYSFINNNPYLFTISKDSIFYQEDDFYSEQKWADKETAIFIALINLAVGFGWCTFFIGDSSFHIPLGMYGFDLKKLTKHSLKKIENIIELYELVHYKTSWDSREFQRNFSYKRDINTKKINILNKKIDRKNSVLIRCLYYFAKSCTFATHHMMIEESTALQMFCLDGLSRLFMKKYKIKKIKNLGEFLQKKFNCPYGEYLEDLHDERTIYVHPLNIHGDYWCPPWDADTCYDTLPVVKDLLLFYLTGIFKISE